MPIKRLTIAAALVSVLLVSGPLQASTIKDAPVTASVGPQLLSQLQVFDPAQMLAQSVAPATADLVSSTEKATASVSGLAMNLRDIRYVRGGRDPSTGFDCSGFVRYVFAHAIGMQLPTNSASQFLEGLKVKRSDMKPGDLVFFRTHGKRNISHVGIYISNGQFIHSPTTGQSVQVSSLDETYWAKHFAGAKRPEAMAMVDHHG
jgi:cell wall-associated NlpC family hydrolase